MDPKIDGRSLEARLVGERLEIRILN